MAAVWMWLLTVVLLHQELTMWLETFGWHRDTIYQMRKAIWVRHLIRYSPALIAIAGGDHALSPEAPRRKADSLRTTRHSMPTRTP